MIPRHSRSDRHLSGTYPAPSWRWQRTVKRPSKKFCSGRFDLVLMDLQIPVMDRYAAARAIRQWEAQRARPRVIILALTGGAIEGGSSSGGKPVWDAQLAKPCRMETFLEAIRHHLKPRDPIRVYARRESKGWFPAIWKAGGQTCGFSRRPSNAAITKPFASWDTISRAPANRMDRWPIAASAGTWKLRRKYGPLTRYGCRFRPWEIFWRIPTRSAGGSWPVALLGVLATSRPPLVFRSPTKVSC